MRTSRGSGSGRVHLYHGTNFHGTNLYQNIFFFFWKKSKREKGCVQFSDFTTVQIPLSVTKDLPSKQDTDLCNDDYNDHSRDGELAGCTPCIWTEGLNVTFDDIRRALDYYSGNIAKTIPKLQKWVHDDKPPGVFCEISPEEYCNVVQPSVVVCFKQ